MFSVKKKKKKLERDFYRLAISLRSGQTQKDDQQPCRAVCDGLFMLASLCVCALTVSMDLCDRCPKTHSDNKWIYVVLCVKNVNINIKKTSLGLIMAHFTTERITEATPNHNTAHTGFYYEHKVWWVITSSASRLTLNGVNMDSSDHVTLLHWNTVQSLWRLSNRWLFIKKW